MSELFIKASRKKWRFTTSKGDVTVEDLWDLNLESLDRLAVALHNKLTAQGTRTSFIGKADPTSDVDTDKLEILKYVIETKMKEAEEAQRRRGRREQRELLTRLLEEKEIAKLGSLSVEDIRAQLAQLGDE